MSRLLTTWLLLAVSSAAAASTPESYLRIRRESGYDPKLTLAQVEARTSHFVGRTLELKGRVEGSIRRENSVSFLLSVEGSKSILLECPVGEQQLITGSGQPRLRVLATVQRSETTNLVPLKVLVIAEDPEITLREQIAEAQARREAEQPKSRGGMTRSDMPIASRGGGLRIRQSPAALGGITPLAMKYLSPEAQSIYPIYRNFVQSHNPRLTDEEADTITVSILHFSPRYRVDPRLVVALIIAESDFKIKTTSHKGAMGLGQLMPDEVRDLGIPDAYDPVWNIRGCVALLKEKLDKYREPGTPEGRLTWKQIELALAAYNAGPGAVKKYGGIPPYRETVNYVAKIKRLFTEFTRGDQ
jgi:hypothetical protein